MRPVAQELAGISGLLGLALIGMVMFDHDRQILLGAGLIYVAWHVVNILRLKWWLHRGYFRSPSSAGLWEAIFDDLQSVQLRNRRRKRALLELLRQLRELAANIPDGAVLLDKERRVQWFNPAAGRLLGLSWPRDSRCRLGDLVGHPVLQDQLNMADKARPVEMPSPVNGALMLRIEISAMRGSEQRLLVARDITKTYNLERSRREFVANVSHELRTPLTVFRGYLEVLEDLAGNDPDLRRPLQLLGQQSVRMQDLVEDLLGLSRLEFSDRRPAAEPVPVPDLLEEIAAEALELVEARDHRLEMTAEQAPWLLGDKAILGTAFSNLIVNALRHTPAGTLVSVTWKREEDGTAVLRVTDDGPGIAAYHLPRLTERFYRVDPARGRDNGGTGLGLAIAKHAVERHGGELRISSTPGRGSTFSCHFPTTAICPAETDRIARRPCL